MKSLFMMMGFVLFAGSSISQTTDCKNDSTKIIGENGAEITLSRLGYTRIFLKDGSIKKNCVLKEINKYWIVYMKDKALHDMAIDRIKRIEVENDNQVIYFDDNNKPRIIKSIN